MLMMMLSLRQEGAHLSFCKQALHQVPALSFCHCEGYVLACHRVIYLYTAENRAALRLSIARQ